jgi:3-hydroxyacyl-CoA dehydrogenase
MVPGIHQAVVTSLEGGVAVVRIDNPPVNALSKDVRQGMIAAFEALARDASVTGIVLTGANGQFIAGADVREMELPLQSPTLPDVVAAIEAAPQPVIAAIEGSALGGGLEIALACDRRLATPSARLGLPEVKLGIIPGAGGTQRLPRLVGVPAAISLICEATILKPQAALTMGLVDEIVENRLVETAIVGVASVRKRRISEIALPQQDKAADEAAAKALKRAKGSRAVAEAVRVIRGAESGAFREGLAREREAFIALRASPEAAALRHLFFAERESWKVPGLEAQARPLRRAAVIGAGTMGAGIAIALAGADLPVLLLERDAAAAQSGRARLQQIYDQQVTGGRLDAQGAAHQMRQIEVSTDWSRLKNCDLIIEAAFEDLAVKQEIFRRLDTEAGDNAVLATNTSYLDIDAIAGVTERPGNVIGLHFFSPAHVMKLLEIVAARETAPDVVATAFALAKRLRKQPVLAGNCDGFIGNRIYAVYRRHTEYLLEDGAMPEEIDAAMEAYGFAMGIFAVSDLSGLDIAHAMRQRRAATRDPGERYVAIADRLCEAGRLGRKTGRGWYSYETGVRQPDPAVRDLILEERGRGHIAQRKFSAEDIQNRLLAVMANEGAKLLAEGIALRASDIDVAFTNGYGFPRSRGGPMFAADRRGAPELLRDMEKAHTAGGAGSEPAPLLIDIARHGGSFAQWRRT